LYEGVHVWVEWDEDGNDNVYGYGATGYDVLIVDEPRKLKIGQEIAVGCVVRPGTFLQQALFLNIYKHLAFSQFCYSYTRFRISSLLFLNIS
jgi:hypothetical protein